MSTKTYQVNLIIHETSSRAAIVKIDAVSKKSAEMLVLSDPENYDMDFGDYISNEVTSIELDSELKTKGV